jgi:hypothetical protein
MSFQPLYKYVDRDTLAETVRTHAADPAQREVAIVDVRGKPPPPPPASIAHMLIGLRRRRL